MQLVDVVVIGGGVTGRSCAYHLERLGYNTKILTSSQVIETNPNLLIAASGTSDLITRPAEARGKAQALELWDYSVQALRYLCQFLDDSHIDYVAGSRLRLGYDSAEVNELKIAQSLLSHRSQTVQSPFLLTHSIRHAEPSLVFRKEDIYKYLKQDTECFAVTQVTEKTGMVELKNDANETLEAEVVIIAAHLSSAFLAGLSSDILVSYSDQWNDFVIKPDKQSALLQPGDFISWRHGYHSAQVLEKRLLRLSGGRYLRKQAGIGETTAKLEPKISEHLKKEAEKILGIELLDEKEAGARSGCQPCDEQPLIGPVPGKSRLLMATGFGGLGVAQGFFAGKCIAEIVQAGRSSDLPRFYWPERLRSLPSE